MWRAFSGRSKTGAGLRPAAKQRAALDKPAAMSHNSPKPVIGVIGGIGSGKSVVAAELAKHGGHLISGDRLGHEALRQPSIKAQIAARWGSAAVDAAGEVDRKRLAVIV